MDSKYLAFDIGGTYIKYGIIQKTGELLYHAKVSTPSNLEGLLSVIEKVYDENQDIDGVGISSPGAVSPEGVIYGSSALPYIHGPNLKYLIQNKIQKQIHLENDANCVANAELWNGHAKGKNRVAVVVIGSGIGGALIHQGKVEHGGHLQAGEFGYMLMQVGDQWKSWSDIASTRALRERVSNLKNISSKQMYSGEQIFDLESAGDHECREAIRDFYFYLALGLYNVQHLYDPDLILIGGGISERTNFKSEIESQLTDINIKVNQESMIPRVEICAFRQHANLFGAVYHYLHY